LRLEIPNSPKNINYCVVSWCVSEARLRSYRPISARLRLFFVFAYFRAFWRFRREDKADRLCRNANSGRGKQSRPRRAGCPYTGIHAIHHVKFGRPSTPTPRWSPEAPMGWSGGFGGFGRRGHAGAGAPLAGIRPILTAVARDNLDHAALRQPELTDGAPASNRRLNDEPHIPSNPSRPSWARG
jgi:hypothetical protein